MLNTVTIAGGGDRKNPPDDRGHFRLCLCCTDCIADGRDGARLSGAAPQAAPAEDAGGIRRYRHGEQAVGVHQQCERGDHRDLLRARLKEANVNDIKDLADLAPSLTVTEVFDIAQIYIRGVGTNVKIRARRAVWRVYTRWCAGRAPGGAAVLCSTLSASKC